MNWNDVINKKDFVWNKNTDSITHSLTVNDSKESSYKLHSSIFKIDQSSYYDFINFLENEVGSIRSIFEYGCGNGALLYYFKNYKNINVGGCDISEYFVEYCNKIIEKNNFFNNTTLIKSNSYDYCISNSVFQYFPDYDYASSVINQMRRISNVGVMITDIKDIETQDIFLETQAHRQQLTISQLKEKYKTTPLMFYSRDFFKDFDIIEMPASYPDSDLKSFCAKLIL